MSRLKPLRCAFSNFVVIVMQNKWTQAVDSAQMCISNGKCERERDNEVRWKIKIAAGSRFLFSALLWLPQTRLTVHLFMHSLA